MAKPQTLLEQIAGFEFRKGKECRGCMCCEYHRLGTRDLQHVCAKLREVVVAATKVLITTNPEDGTMELQQLVAALAHMKEN